MQQNAKSKKTRIAQIVCAIPPTAGGIGMVAHSYSDQLVKRGYEVDVYVPKSVKDVTVDKSYRVKPLWPLIRIGFGAIMPQLIWKLWHYDIIHLHYPFLATSLFVSLVKRIRRDKIKFIITYHMDLVLSGWKGLYVSIMQKLFLKFILNSADKIVISSEDYIENCIIQDYYFENISKFVEIPFGVPRKFKPQEKNLKLLNKYNFKIDDKVVLFVGGLDSAHYFKGINYLIKSFTFIKDTNIKALIVGTGNLQKQYKLLTERLGLSSRIKFSGYVEKELLVDYYNVADLFVLPSINSSEAFGIVLLEAMACGKPVIASNLKGVRSVVDSGINGLLCEPKNSRDISEKIKCILENEEMYKRFSRSCLETVEKKYRWSIITDKLEEIYKSKSQ